MDAPKKNTNGPKTTFIGASIGLLAYSAVLIDKELFPGYEVSPEASDASFVIFLFILLPLMLIGGIMFLYGIFKTSIFYSVLSQRSKLLFWGTFVFAPLLLFAGVQYNRYLTRPTESSDREIYCGQVYRNANTAEGVDAYRSCLDNTSVQETELQDNGELQVVPLISP